MPQNQNRAAPNARSRGKKFVIAGGVLGGVGLLVGALFTIIQLSSPTTPDLIQGFTYIMICVPLPLIIIGGILLTLGISNLRRGRNTIDVMPVPSLQEIENKLPVPPPITGYKQPPSTNSEIKAPVTKATTDQIPPSLDPVVQAENYTLDVEQEVEILIKQLDDWYRSMDEYEGDNNPDYSAISPAEKKLKEIGIPAVVPLVSSLALPDWRNDEDRIGAVERILLSIGSPSVEPLIAALKDKNKIRAAAQILGKFKDKRAVEPLIEAMEDVEPQIVIGTRMHVIWSLGEIGDIRAVEPLIAALKDEGEYIRSSAAMALGELKDGRAITPLVNILDNDAKAHVTVEAAKALRKLGWTRN